MTKYQRHLSINFKKPINFHNRTKLLLQELAKLPEREKKSLI